MKDLVSCILCEFLALIISSEIKEAFISKVLWETEHNSDWFYQQLSCSLWSKCSLLAKELLLDWLQEHGSVGGAPGASGLQKPLSIWSHLSGPLLVSHTSDSVAGSFVTREKPGKINPWGLSNGRCSGATRCESERSEDIFPFRWLSTLGLLLMDSPCTDSTVQIENIQKQTMSTLNLYFFLSLLL